MVHDRILFYYQLYYLVPMISQKKNTHFQEDILRELSTIQKKDFTFSNGHILGSMCTAPHPIAKKAYLKFLETNLGDPELFPGTKELETRFIQFILKLLHAPKTATGHIVSGGTEGNITAMWIAKELTRKNEIIIPESAHFSFAKIASMMDVNLRLVPLTSEYIMDINKVRKNITKNTAAVVAVAGSTELGTIDPIPELSDLCNDEHLFLHVDAAFGGFVIPFLHELGYEVPDFDFQLQGVSTICVDSHKMGWSAIPMGTLCIRKNSWLKEISVKSPCISSKTQAGILGTRPGGPIAAAYAVTKYLGCDGYTKLVKRCMQTTQYMEKQIMTIGLSVVQQPTMNVLGVRIKNPTKLVHALSQKGWRVNAVEHLSCIRLVMMPHVTKKIVDDFIPVLKKTCEEIREL